MRWMLRLSLPNLDVHYSLDCAIASGGESIELLNM